MYTRHSLHIFFKFSSGLWPGRLGPPRPLRGTPSLGQCQDLGALELMQGKVLRRPVWSWPTCLPQRCPQPWPAGFLKRRGSAAWAQPPESPIAGYPPSHRLRGVRGGGVRLRHSRAPRILLIGETPVSPLWAVPHSPPLHVPSHQTMQISLEQEALLEPGSEIRRAQHRGLFLLAIPQQ